MLNNVPVPGQSLGSSRSLINANFSTIDTAFSIDHVQYNDGSGDQGKHKKITFPVQSPAPSFSGTNLGLYNFVNPTTTKSEIYVHKINGVTTADIPFTASTLSSTTSPASGASFWTYLPSGILIIKGTATANGLATINFSSVGAPTLTQILGISLTVSTGGSTSDVNTAISLVDTPTVSTFRVYGSARTTSSAASTSFIYWVWGY
jgi:hypothetical protein